MKNFLQFAAVGMLVILLGSCDSCNTTDKNAATDQVVVAETDVVAIPVLTEESVCNVPIKSVTADQEASKTQKEGTASKTLKPVKKELDRNLAPLEIQPEQAADIPFFCFTSDELNTTKTVVSYQKNGEEYFQVISDSLNPDIVDYIVFTDKKEKTDVYDVSVGMTAKDARQLRKELKHFVKKGKVFLAVDDSNILYELAGDVPEGTEITDEVVDQMSISAIIWKDKDTRK